MENKIIREIKNRKTSGKTVEDLARDIRGEEVPPRLLDLAHTLQAALDARKDGEEQ